MDYNEAEQILTLVDWRRRIARLYQRIRELSVTDPAGAWGLFRETRDRMFAAHPQSPLEEATRSTFTGIDYFPYNPAWRLEGEVESLHGGAASEAFVVHVPEGEVRCRPFAAVRFVPPGSGRTAAVLTLFWIEGYGGGIFLPFADLTSGTESYGGGRYLCDTIKGADLGSGPNGLILDFNFAYNPSCAYSPRFICPLAPAENRLPFRVEAGELSPTVFV